MKSTETLEQVQAEAHEHYQRTILGRTGEGPMADDEAERWKAEREDLERRAYDAIRAGRAAVFEGILPEHLQKAIDHYTKHGGISARKRREWSPA